MYIIHVWCLISQRLYYSYRRWNLSGFLYPFQLGLVNPVIRRAWQHCRRLFTSNAGAGRRAARSSTLTDDTCENSYHYVICVSSTTTLRRKYLQLLEKSWAIMRCYRSAIIQMWSRKGHVYNVHYSAAVLASILFSGVGVVGGVGGGAVNF